MTREELDIKPMEFLIATKDMPCSLCEKIIVKDTPYVLKQTIVRTTKGWQLEKIFECVWMCSQVKQHHDEHTKKRALYIHPSWASLPEYATEAEKKLRIVVSKSGTWVATSYVRIIEWDTPEKELGFVEFDQSQVQKKAFALDPREKDSFGGYQTYVARCGMQVRLYDQTRGEMQAGRWYMPIGWLTAIPGVEKEPKDTKEPRATKTAGAA